MSGDNVPYQLRPNKFIDRQLFMDFLSRTVPTIGAEKYVHISMGGRHLVDHHAVYRQIGIPWLCSFDFDENVVLRQKKNRPVDTTICLAIKSVDLSGEIDGIVNKCKGSKNIIVWLDYTNPKEILSQLQEAVEIMKRMRQGDILRITMNSDVRALAKPEEWQQQRASSPAAYRARKLKDRVGSFMPTNVSSIGDHELPMVLVQCVRLATAKAEGENGQARFSPALITKYMDTTPMVTVTVMARNKSEKGFSLPSLNDWKFAAKSWRSMISISAPDLSIREKLDIDRNLSMTSSKILKMIGYFPGSDRAKARQALEDYKRLHRYYPSFSHVAM
jgi:hypothetical protein